MNRFIYILTLLSIILSCSKHELKEDDVASSQDKVELRFSVTVPGEEVASKALGINPNIRTLHLAIFDAAGYFLEYVTANLETTGNIDNAENYYYSADVTPTDGKTTVHFIANGPKTVSFANETKLIGNLSTSGNNDAYWQRIVLEDGIQITKNEKENTATCNITSPINLIRNFARIEVELSGNARNKYTLSKIYVANTPDKGSIAIYDSREGEFLDGNKYIGKTHADLYDEGNGYDAFVPYDATLQSDIPTSADFVKSPFFVYEREYPLSNAAFILLEGTYHYDNIDETRYFKVDLRNSNGDYFPIFRNFIYKITITDLHHAGKTSIADAFEGAGSGDVSSNLDYKDFTNISNGHVQLYVSTTNVTMVNSEEEVELKYKFITFNDTDSGTTKTIENNEVEITPGIDELTGAVSSYTISNKDDSEGWRSVKIKAGTIDDEVAHTTLRFTGTSIETDSQGNTKTYSIYRDVEVYLREKWSMTLTCDDDHVLKKQNEEFDVVLGVPGGMSQVLFPLDFKIEAANLSIAPNNDNLPTETGVSIIPNKDAHTFRFVKSLSWDEYSVAEQIGAYRQIRCHFKTSKDISATKIWAANKYFNSTSTDLFNYDPYKFTNLDFDPDPIIGISGIAVDFKFTMRELAIDNIPIEVIVTLDGLEPVNNDQLEYIDNNAAGLARYKYRPSDYNNTLKLRTTSANDKVNVTLEAYRFETASTDCERTLYDFTTGRFDSLKNVTSNNRQFTFSFEIPTFVANNGNNMDINITAERCTVSSASAGSYSAGKLTLTRAQYDALSNKSVTLTLNATDQGISSRSVSITLKSDGYNDKQFEGKTATIKNKRINSGYLNNVSNGTNGSTQCDVIISLEGNVSTNTKSNVSRRGTRLYYYEYSQFTINNWDIEYTDLTQQVTITLKYNNNDYVGTCTVQDLLNPGNITVTLTGP